ncbi:histidine kinase [Roseibacillus ishigakijimensis]|uniref:Oxygen sensor histidine kinase NreB n=1 Tax=Roseibacillus ishigakijimensis TaxID=454146 RepID=A0A934RRJ0_9BACT|nr:histidine kinase [Roseibacillus ishigakijimensis]MBK1834597.1 hypothetical protein [Roseibacillus ishigakijimensis]
MFRWSTLLFFYGVLSLQGQLSLEPYRADEHTLHLWHLDELSPPFANANTAGSPALQGLFHGAEAGRPSLPGLARAISFHHHEGGLPGTSSLRGALLSLSPQMDSGPGDNAPPSFRYFGPDGAFTYEALIKLALLPHEAEVIALGILSMDGENDDRIFNFRIEKEGFLVLTPLPDSGTTGGAMATIPTEGPHALNTLDWFHVAVTYDGRESTTNNTRLYWTRLAGSPRAAHHIGSGTLSHDFNGRQGDFVIGNEGRSFLEQGGEENNAFGEPFPGLIDEVRISSVARQPSDFLFVPSSRRVPSRPWSESEQDQSPLPRHLHFGGIAVDEKVTPLPAAGKLLVTSPGARRLDFDFGLPTHLPGTLGASLRYQLEGYDEQWHEIRQGMVLSFQFLDATDHTLSKNEFQALGNSPGWSDRLSEATLSERSEPLFVPPGSHTLQIVLSSGSATNTGSFALDDLAIRVSESSENHWPNGSFHEGSNLTSPAGLPRPWQRDGDDPAIAQVTWVENSTALSLVDGSQKHRGRWVARLPLSEEMRQETILQATWREAFNVIGGVQHRVSYQNVPPGDYTFRVIGALADHTPLGGVISQPLRVPEPILQRTEFWVGIAILAIGLLAAYLHDLGRRRARRELRQLEFEHRLEQDRARIARDMHDDLGTRISIINLAASLARGSLRKNAEKCEQQLERVTRSARDLVTAMDQLVWVIDPAHDNLEDFASHLMRLSEELFQDHPIRCRLEIPDRLPALVLRSDQRHNLALAVKEGLHNVLRHSQAREARLVLRHEQDTLLIRIEDDGRGFSPGAAGHGNGLQNFHSRLQEIGGRAELVSTPGQGTTLTFSLPLASDPNQP